MNNIKEAISKSRKMLTAAEAFAEKFCDKMPSDFGLWMSLDFQTPTAGISLSNHRGMSRDRMLTLAGQVFGTTGWKRSLNSSRNCFDWTQDFDGVQVYIYEVETVADPMDGSPVLPTQFPLLLETSVEIQTALGRP